jgi:hypothetical protein
MLKFLITTIELLYRHMSFIGRKNWSKRRIRKWSGSQLSSAAVQKLSYDNIAWVP